MPLHNEEIASAFDEMADLLAIQGDNPFRIRAYRRAAQVVRTLPREVAEQAGTTTIEALPGIGEDLAAKIRELAATGHLRALEKLRHDVPAGLRELLELPGLGPVRVRALYSALGVKSLEALRRALAAGKLGDLRGFGPGIRSRLAAALEARAAGPERRVPWSVARQSAGPLKAYLEAVRGVERVEVAGSFRRGRDTVGDLDVLVSATDAAPAAASLARYEELREITASGETKLSAVLRSGLKVDVRIVAPSSFGAALEYFTGSREHGIRLRRRAQERGLKLSEYGLYRGRRRIAGATEEEIFRALGLPWIAPELREDRGEIEAAERHALPKLIERADLKGDLHVHTDASDGTQPLEEMVAAARERGLSYLAVADHSKYIGVTRGLDAERLSRAIDAVDALNGRLKGFTVLKGAEVDILEDGGLALPDSLLARLDLVMIALHTQLRLPEAKQTRRLLRALERPCVTVLAHPFGRLLGERAGASFDFERVLEAAAARPCYLEINSQPLRLDLDDVHAKAARDRGVLLSIASDAHAGSQIDYLEDGVRQARRGWVSAADVLNTRTLKELRPLLRRTMR
jgi:DNA polymerase (family 10)